MQSTAEIHRIEGSALILPVDDLSAAVFAVLQKPGRPLFAAVSVTADGVFLVDSQDRMHHLVDLPMVDAELAVSLNVLRVREIRDNGNPEHDIEYSVRNLTLENEPEIGGLSP